MKRKIGYLISMVILIMIMSCVVVLGGSVTMQKEITHTDSHVNIDHRRLDLKEDLLVIDDEVFILLDDITDYFYISYKIRDEKILIDTKSNNDGISLFEIEEESIKAAYDNLYTMNNQINLTNQYMKHLQKQLMDDVNSSNTKGVQKHTRTEFVRGLDYNLYIDDEEAFIGRSYDIDGNIFVPIIDLIEAFSFNIFINPINYNVDIYTISSLNNVWASDIYSLNSMQYMSLIENRNEIDRLKRELELKEKGIKYQSISNTSQMNDYLNEYYGELGGINVEYYLRDLARGRHRLSITINPRRYYSYYSLDYREVENHIEEVMEVIEKLYKEDLDLEGHVYLGRSTRKELEFKRVDNKTIYEYDRLRFQGEPRFDAKSLENYLNDEFSRYLRVDFEYEVSFNNMPFIKVHTSDSRFERLSVFNQMNYLKSLEREIRYLFPSMNMAGEIVLENDSIDFLFIDGRIISRQMIERAEEYLNDNSSYTRQRIGRNTVNLEYKVIMKDEDTLILRAEIKDDLDDLNIENREEFIDELDQSLSFGSVHYSPVRFLEDLMNVEVEGRIYDKNLRVLKNLSTD